MFDLLTYSLLPAAYNIELEIGASKWRKAQIAVEKAELIAKGNRDRGTKEVKPRR